MKQQAQQNKPTLRVSAHRGRRGHPGRGNPGAQWCTPASGNSLCPGARPECLPGDLLAGSSAHYEVACYATSSPQLDGNTAERKDGIIRGHFLIEKPQEDYQYILNHGNYTDEFCKQAGSFK